MSRPDGPVRVLLVDDHPVVRDGLAGQLAAADDLRVVGEAGSAEEALALLRRTAVDVLVTDLRLPGMDGLDLVGAVAAQHPGVAVLVLTTYDDPEDIGRARAAGARGYLLKEAGRETIAAGVRAVHAGRTVLGAGLRGPGTEDPPSRPLLSGRELEVLRLVAAGRTNAQIGSALFIGEATVKTHLKHLCAKLAATDRASAVAAGYRRGLL